MDNQTAEAYIDIVGLERDIRHGFYEQLRKAGESDKIVELFNVSLEHKHGHFALTLSSQRMVLGNFDLIYRELDVAAAVADSGFERNMGKENAAKVDRSYIARDLQSLLAAVQNPADSRIGPLLPSTYMQIRGETMGPHGL